MKYGLRVTVCLDIRAKSWTRPAYFCAVCMLIYINLSWNDAASSSDDRKRKREKDMTTGAILWPDNADSTPPYNLENFKAECLERLPSKESYSNQAAVIEEVGSTVPEEAPAKTSEQFL